MPKKLRRRRGLPPKKFEAVIGHLTAGCRDCGDLVEWDMYLLWISEAHGWHKIKLCASKPNCRKGNFWFGVHPDREDFLARNHDTGVLVNHFPELHQQLMMFLADYFDSVPEPTPSLQDLL